MNSKNSHRIVTRKTAELDLALLNWIDELRESKLSRGEKVEACERELAYPIAGILSLLKEEYRREVVKKALDLAQRATVKPNYTTVTRKSGTMLAIIKDGEE